MATGSESSKKNNTLHVWGNERTMNINHLILTNIVTSNYFKNDLQRLKTFHEIVDEIYNQVSHLEPWEKGSRKLAGQTGMCGGVSYCLCTFIVLFNVVKFVFIIHT
eukprot:TRINITY_DN962_c0_g1_i6.p1 TRINITY_DN962_c0_g1~~TRINITY_DN962_c0_g1_i6.p1  ORF type:complete len:106 (-),score=19.12 TRINITY_DN962_c0_g1_i6:244-561(-)